MSDSLRRHEKSDIAKLSRITREDHSTIFFTGLTDAGYIRDGTVYSVVLDHGDHPSGAGNYCLDEAVSRDGSRIVYATLADSADRCRFLVRDLITGKERILADFEQTARLFSWSWDDKEIAYQGPGGIAEVSVADGSRRIWGKLPLQMRPESWTLRAIDWTHHGPELMLDLWVCIPTREPGTCNVQGQVVLFSPTNSRVLEVGAWCGAVSPSEDRIAYIKQDKLLVIDVNSSNRRVVTNMPWALPLLPFLRESPGSTIVWSPTGDRLWFNTIIDEGGNTNVYLVDITTGRRRRILKHTLITVTAWRPSSPIPGKR